MQYVGAAGTLASLGDGDDGLRVRKELAKELGLVNPSITWHVARDGVAEIVNFLVLIGGSLGKIALDLIIMSSNEYGEVSEPFVPHRGASSTIRRSEIQSPARSFWLLRKFSDQMPVWSWMVWSRTLSELPDHGTLSG